MFEGRFELALRYTHLMNAQLRADALKVYFIEVLILQLLFSNFQLVFPPFFLFGKVKLFNDSLEFGALLLESYTATIWHVLVRRL